MQLLLFDIVCSVCSKTDKMEYSQETTKAQSEGYCTGLDEHKITIHPPHILTSVSKDLHSVENRWTTEQLALESDRSNSPHTGVNLVLEEVCENREGSVMCTGWQLLSFSPAYQPSSMVYCHSYPLKKQNHILHLNQNRSQLQAPNHEETPSSASLERGSWLNSVAPNYKDYYECSVQETSQRSGKQELVIPNHSVKFWQCSRAYTTTSSNYAHAELERPELLIKPFSSLAPE